MTTDNDILIRIQGHAGRITLNRPDALNALTHDMVFAIEAALTSWAANDNIALVIIDGTGERAFCAGGDIGKLYQKGIKGEYEYGQTFWRDEYRLNALIANYPKPYIAIMNGIVMGGGVGISAHGSHRLVTQHTVLAMPECGIGLVPDVGGSLLLARAPGHVGEFMACTGARLNASEAVFAGFADHVVDAAGIDDVTDQLCATGSVDVISKFTQSKNENALDQQLDIINFAFGSGNLNACVKKLELRNDTWAQSSLHGIHRGSPLSLCCAWQMVQNARKLHTIEDALNQEYRFSYRAQQEADLLEGIRALIVDKDKNPCWQHDSIANVDKSLVAHMLSDLGEAELNLGG